MENRTIEFVKKFNEQLELKDVHNFLEFKDNGYTKAVFLPEIYLFDGDSDSTEFVEQRSLSRLVKKLDMMLKVSSVELDNKLSLFFEEKRKEIKDKFPSAKVKFLSHNILSHFVYTSGEFNKNELLNILDTIKQDFEYIFENLKLDIDFSKEKY